MTHTAVSWDSHVAVIPWAVASSTTDVLGYRSVDQIERGLLT